MSCSRNHNVDVQGHRGARGLAPENTIYGFKKALDICINTIELDVVINGENEVLISHEPWFSKQKCYLDTNFIDEKVSYNIYNMTYDEIKKIDCGNKFIIQFPNQEKLFAHKPLLKEAIKEVESYVIKNNLTLPFYNIEIKSSKNGDKIYHPKYDYFSELVYYEIKNLLDLERFNIQSFDFRVLNYFNQKYPDVVLAVLVDNNLDPEENLNRLGFFPEIYSPNFRTLKKPHIIYLQNKKIKIIPWTVNSYDDITQVLNLNVDGIISDYPDRVIEILK